MMSVNYVLQGMMDMELNEKERMLVHLAINSVISGGDADEMMRTIYHVRKHRCRHMENDEVIYFYKMPYYKAELNYNIEESYRLVDNNIVIVEDDDQHKIFIDYYNHYKEGIMHLEELSEKNNIYHNDFLQLKYFCENSDEYIKNKNNYPAEQRTEYLNRLMDNIN